jgi:hypothetical protein
MLPDSPEGPTRISPLSTERSLLRSTSSRLRERGIDLAPADSGRRGLGVSAQMSG